MILLILAVLFFYFQYSKSQELEKSNKLIEDQNKKIKEISMIKDKIYTILAHDIKNPLLGIELEIENLLNSEVISDEIKSKLRKINNSSSELVGLFNNLYNWANLESGEIELNIKRLDLYELVLKAINVNSSLAETKNIKIINRVKDDSIVLADNNTLFAILHNLINNAIKFSENEGFIEIWNEFRDEKVWVNIKDNGVGADVESIDEMMDYEAEEGSIQSKSKGSGLGLKVIKEFVECNGGIIKMTSNKGYGTLVSFSLDHGTSMRRFTNE